MFLKERSELPGPKSLQRFIQRGYRVYARLGGAFCESIAFAHMPQQPDPTEFITSSTNTECVFVCRLVSP